MINQIEQWLRENSITEVECLVPDLGGIARGKILPTNKFIHGLKDDTHRLPQSIFIQTISGDYATEDDEGLPHDIYNPTDIDVKLRPDFNTIRSVPWYEDPTAQVICDAVSLNNNSITTSSRYVLKNILEINNDPLVSSDFNHNPNSAIVDTALTKVIDNKMAKVSAWYDNEWGFACRMCDLANYFGKI